MFRPRFSLFLVYPMSKYVSVSLNFALFVCAHPLSDFWTKYFRLSWASVANSHKNICYVHVTAPWNRGENHILLIRGLWMQCFDNFKYESSRFLTLTLRTLHVHIDEKAYYLRFCALRSVYRTKLLQNKIIPSTNVRICIISVCFQFICQRWVLKTFRQRWEKQT